MLHLTKNTRVMVIPVALMSCWGFTSRSADIQERIAAAEAVLRGVYGEHALRQSRMSAPEADSPWRTDWDEYGHFVFLAESGRMLGFFSHQLESRGARIRSIEPTVNDEPQARRIADPIANRLGDWELHSIEFSSDEPDTTSSTMRVLGSALCEYLRKGDPLWLMKGNRLRIRLDRFDGAVLSVGITDVFRPTSNVFRITEAEAKRIADGLVAGWKSEADRRILSMTTGHGYDEIAFLKQLENEVLREVGTEPAYRATYADKHGSFVVISAVDGRILSDGRKGR